MAVKQKKLRNSSTLTGLFRIVGYHVPAIPSAEFFVVGSE